MKGARLVLSLVAVLVQLPDEPVNEPALVRDGQVHRLAPQEPAVVHQQERGLEDQLFLIFRPQAKET